MGLNNLTPEMQNSEKMRNFDGRILNIEKRLEKLEKTKRSPKPKTKKAVKNGNG